MQGFAPLRDEAEKRAIALKSDGSEKKAPREEVCTLFKSFSAAEAKIVKFIKRTRSSAASRPRRAHDEGQSRPHREDADQVCAGGGRRPGCEADAGPA